jgi:dTDP-4-dehydrorhamnose 3,5-epimerase
LKGGDGNALLIGTGLGHGFISQEQGTSVSYLLSSPYAPQFEYEVNPLDSELKINWHLEMIKGVDQVCSSKDFNAPTLISRELEGQLP